MKPWFKVGEDIIDCIKTDHQFTIDNEWVNSYFTIDLKYNNTYFNIIFDLYNNKKTFDWEDNKSKGSISTIKSIDVTDNIITCQVKSKKWGIKDKSDERDKRIDEILKEKDL
jgi:hypothetical protein